MHHANHILGVSRPRPVFSVDISQKLLFSTWSYSGEDLLHLVGSVLNSSSDPFLVTQRYALGWRDPFFREGNVAGIVSDRPRVYQYINIPNKDNAYRYPFLLIAYLIYFYKLRGKNRPGDILLFVYYTVCLSENNEKQKRLTETVFPHVRRMLLSYSLSSVLINFICRTLN